uniref:Kinesin motor domain-containing protein n=1 Tax=Steinernema glaseri TaxID=37863 RepID=A0A1I7ZBK2_9BILA
MTAVSCKERKCFVIKMRPSHEKKVRGWDANALTILERNTPAALDSYEDRADALQQRLRLLIKCRSIFHEQWSL